MKAVQRYDLATGRLGKVTRTAQGGIKVPARVTRTGILLYRNPDGSERREYRPPAEVAREDSLDQLSDAPVTNLHPPDMATPETFREVTVGHVSGRPTMDGAYVEATLVIQDARTIGQIEAGERNEVSCGYICDIEHKPGETPDGERYDAIQTNIRYNHVALVPRGRAGRDVALRLDSDENQIPPGAKEADDMKIEIIDGTEYEVGTDAHKTAVQRRDAAETETRGEVDRLKGENATLKEKVADLETRLDAKDGEIQERVKARIEIETLAKAKGVEVRADMSDEDIRLAVLGKLAPGLDLEGKSPEFIEGALNVALVENPGNAKSVRADIQDARRNDGERQDGADQEPPDVVARNKMISRLAGRKEQ